VPESKHSPTSAGAGPPGGKIITATHTRIHKLWKLSPTVHLRHFEFQDRPHASPRSPLPALSVQRAADVPLSCLVCVGMTAPYPCYVLISDRTMCEGSGKGGNAERFHAIAFMTTHFDQHCDVVLTMPAPTPPDSWLRTCRWLSLSAHARRAARLGGITSGEHNQVNLGLWFGTTRARQRKGACMASLPTRTCACMPSVLSCLRNTTCWIALAEQQPSRHLIVLPCVSLRSVCRSASCVRNFGHVIGFPCTHDV
jgi:hypothetical protein